MCNVTASFALLASLILSSPLTAGPWGTSLRFGQTEVQQRLALDTAYTVIKNGSAGPYQLYNHAAGYSIAGSPAGDAIIGHGFTGNEAVRPLMAMFDYGEQLYLADESILYCHSSPGLFNSPGYSVFRPLSVNAQDTVSSTRIDVTLGVQKNNITRLRVARKYASVATGFNSSLNDHLLLEISNGVLWVWPTNVGYSRNTSVRRKIASMTTTDVGNRKLTPYNLAIDLGSQGESCSVKLMPTDGQRFLAFQQPLPAEYCDLHDQNQLVFAIEVDQGSAQGQSTNSISSLCLSNMEVVSELVR